MGFQLESFRTISLTSFFAVASAFATAGDQLLVNSHETDPASGSVVMFDGQTNALQGKITDAFGSPKVLNLDLENTQLLVSSDLNSGISAYNFLSPSISSFASGSTIEGMTRDHCGNIFVSEFGSDRVRVLNPSGTEIYTINMPSNSLPMGLAFDPRGRLIVAARGRNSIPVFYLTYDGCQVTGAALTVSAGISSCGPSGLAFDASGNLYVSCFINGAIKKVTLNPTTSQPTVLGNFAMTPSLNGSAAGNRGLVWHENNLYVTNVTHGLIYKIGSAGGAPSGTLGAGQLVAPQSIVVKKAFPPVVPTLTMEPGTNNGDFNLKVKANPNQSVKILVTDSLEANSWTELSSGQADANGNYQFTDAANQQRRFYKLSYNFYEIQASLPQSQGPTSR